MQLATCSYFLAADIPFLGAWSKPRPRLFRKPVSDWDIAFPMSRLRERVFEGGDGYYVALCLSWLELAQPRFENNQDPVAQTLNNHLGGAHWIIQDADRKFLILLENPVAGSCWEESLPKIAPGSESDLSWDNFDNARIFLLERVEEMREGEALLISVA